MAATDPERVRMLVVTDWDAGFSLTATTPLPNIGPGEAYVTECFPQRPIVIQDVLVEGFALVQISVGTRTSKATVEQQGFGCCLYHLDPPLAVIEDGQSVRVHLCNNSDAPLKQKSVALIRASVRPERKA